MAQLIDTSIFITLERRGLRLNDLLAATQDERIAISSVTASELLTGIYRANTPARRQRRERFVEVILDRVPIFPIDLLVARTHARIWAELASTGQMIGAHDLLIASTALTHGYAILTGNEREFQRIPGLHVQQPQWLK